MGVWYGVVRCVVMEVMTIGCVDNVYVWSVRWGVYVSQCARAVQGGRLKFYCVRTRGFKSHSFCISRPVHGSFLREYVRVNATN